MNETLNKPPCVPRPAQKCYLVSCLDKPGSSDFRSKHLAGHLNHVETYWQRYLTAGPIRNPDEEALIGSVFLVFADSLNDCKSLMAGDPYVTCGMYDTITYHELTNSVGQYLGGKIWENIDSIAHRAAGGPADDITQGLKS